MKGEWILKEVYFEDGWPSVMRDPIVTPDDRELMDRAWDYLASYTVGERPNASEVNNLIFALESRLSKPETPYTTLTDQEELAENPVDAAEPLPNGKTMNKDDIVRMAWKANLPSCHITHPKALERFANLVAAHERDRIADKLMEMHNAQKNRNNYFAFAARFIREEA